jgi:hypothetical protein
MLDRQFIKLPVNFYNGTVRIQKKLSTASVTGNVILIRMPMIYWKCYWHHVGLILQLLKETTKN